MRNSKLIVFLAIVFICVIFLIIYANFTVAPFVTNIEINESKKFEDKVIVNVYVDNYFFKFNKDAWCIVTNDKSENNEEFNEKIDNPITEEQVTKLFYQIFFQNK